MSESDIEKKCNLLVERAGGIHRKLDTGYGSKGWVDQAYWTPGGEHWIVEFKIPGERPGPRQQHTIDQLAAVGQHVYVVDSVAAFRRILVSKLFSAGGLHRVPDDV